MHNDKHAHKEVYVCMYACCSAIKNAVCMELCLVMQQIPGISPTGKFTTLFPLCLVLLATAVKEIIEDVVRMSL